MNDSKFYLTMRFHEESYPDLLDISSLLYDFELAHDYGVVLSEKEYQNYKFSLYFWYRHGRPLEAHHRVKATRIIKRSPLEITVIIASIGALWILIQIIDKVANWPLNRKKLRLEVKKLELEIEEKKKLNDERIAFAQQQRESREGALALEMKLIKRLSASELKLIDLEIEPVNEDPDDNHKNRKG